MVGAKWKLSLEENGKMRKVWLWRGATLQLQVEKVKDEENYSKCFEENGSFSTLDLRKR